MPELPEVECVRLGLEQLVLGKEIQKVAVSWERIVVTDQSLLEWEAALVGQVIEGFRRRGKYLIFQLTDAYLVSHLRMEGKYHYFQSAQIPATKDKHTHVVFTFTDGSQLHYQDVRKFGRIELVAPADLSSYFAKRKLGPEPTEDDFHLDEFFKDLQSTRRLLKPYLLSQEPVVGLGNIYVDEALFHSRLHPQRPANSLTLKEAQALRQAIIEVLAEAVELGGTTIRTYLNSLGEAGTFQQRLQVYGRTGQVCVNCQTPIEKLTVGQRGTHICPRCQVLAEVGQ